MPLRRVACSLKWAFARRASSLKLAALAKRSSLARRAPRRSWATSVRICTTRSLPNSDLIFGVQGEDVLYGGDGNDYLDGREKGPKNTQRDELYCGAGRDKAIADNKIDSVSSSCEVKVDPPNKGGRVVRVD